MDFVESHAVNYADLRDNEILTLTTKSDHRNFQFYENLKKSSGVKLNELQVSKGLHNLFVAVWNC